jgi:sec-independent protein translocase protein TatA
MGMKWTEILLILFALLLLFGATRLPQLGSSLGSAIRNFKRGFSGDGDANGAGGDDAKKLSKGDGDRDVTSSEKSTTKNS